MKFWFFQKNLTFYFVEVMLKKKKKKIEVINDKSFHIHVPRGSTSIIGLSNVSHVKNHLYITDY